MTFGDERLPARFWTKVSIDSSTGCWLWTGATGGGYGRVWFGGRMRQAHSVAYEQLVGDVPAGLQLDHVQARGCSSPLCCLPLHLEPVTGKTNMHRGNSPSMRVHRSDACSRGHLKSENSWVDIQGRIRCRTCSIEKWRKKDSDPVTRLRRVDQYRARKDAGLCPICGKAATGGGFCVACKANARARQAASKARRHP